MHWTAYPAMALGVALTCCRASLTTGSQPIPLADRAPWQTVLADSTFRIAMDTAHVQRGPGNGWMVWFITTHASPQGPDTLRFDRGRIRLLVRCTPLEFKSMSEELALGDSPPVFRQAWQLTGRDAVAWRVPQPGTTDAQFLRTACGYLVERRGAP